MRRARGQAGVTLTELMISVAIISVGILGFMGAFKYITQALHGGRARTLSTNLAQEKIETLKNLTYYELLITTSASVDNNFSPGIVYDNQNYPPTKISIGGVDFTRYTFVALAQVYNDVVSTVSYTYPDTGMKEVVSTIVWKDAGSWRKFSLTNLLENPNVAPLDASIKGTVTATTPSGASLGALASAIVRVEQNPDYQTMTASDGSYAFTVFHGTYTIRVSSAGYWDKSSMSFIAKEGQSVNVSAVVLPQIGTGSISGLAWISSNVVISQVVADTVTAAESYASPAACAAGCTGGNAYGCANPSAGTQVNVCYRSTEYIEFFNPTPSQFNLCSDLTCTSSYVSLDYSGANASRDTGSFNVSVMISSYIAPNHYYLISNTSFFMLNGQWMHADMAYSNNVLSADLGGCGSLAFNSANNGTYIATIDQVGWLRDSLHAGTCSGSDNCPSYGPPTNSSRPCYGFGTPIGQLGTAGLSAGNQFVRVSSPAASMAAIAQWGRAYNSGWSYVTSQIGGNNLDFVYPGVAGYTGINIQPSHENTADRVAGVGIAGHTDISTAIVVTGVPGIKAYISASDPFSGSTRAYVTYIASGSLSLPVASFTLVGVTTTVASAASCAGQCWSVDVASNAYDMLIATVTVSQNVVHWIPDGTTSSTWPVANQYDAVMYASTGGYVEGAITDVNGLAINGGSSGVQITVGAITKQIGTNGNYFIPATTGAVTVVANSNNASPYVQVIAMPTVNTGQITTQNFMLSQGGTLYGYITGGTTPLPNYTVSAQIGGNEMGVGVSNTSGNFYIRNLATGTYAVTPVLEIGQSASPTEIDYNLTTPGAGPVFIGTFTVNGAMGVISGSVTLSGQAVTTGALILASTTAWTTSQQTNGPSAIVGSSAPALSPMYAISSLADGTYSLPVRGGSSYYLLVYIPTLDNKGHIQVSTATYGSNPKIFVDPGGTKTQPIAQ